VLTTSVAFSILLKILKGQIQSYSRSSDFVCSEFVYFLSFKEKAPCQITDFTKTRKTCLLMEGNTYSSAFLNSVCNQFGPRDV